MDSSSLGPLFRDASSAVHRLCAALVDEQSADDLVQETFARAVAAASAFRGESSGRTWLLGIARHVCLDEIRQRQRRRARDGRVVPAPLSTQDGSEAGALSELITRLEPDRRAAFVLTQLLGLSYVEAAEVCGCPPGTIRSRVARARGDLVAWLERGSARSLEGGPGA